jgi:ElaB/YqjD/DUF883 family membrane-anchored ribosome-binding protein
MNTPNPNFSDAATDLVEEARAQTDEALKGLAADARKLTSRGVAAVREGTQQLRDQGAHLADSTVGYIKDEPVKSVLIAAAVGAALMALVTLASRSFGGRN